MTIPPDLEAQILRYYHVEKWRVGTIARQLHVHHGTVARVLAQAGLPRIGPPARRMIGGTYAETARADCSLPIRPSPMTQVTVPVRSAFRDFIDNTVCFSIFQVGESIPPVRSATYIASSDTAVDCQADFPEGQHNRVAVQQPQAEKQLGRNQRTQPRQHSNA
jgi:hypothetical protein